MQHISGIMEAKISGMKFTKPTNELWSQLKEGVEVILEKEPDNPYDKNAVKVIFDGFHLGYVDKINAKNVTDETKAIITRVYGTPDYKPHIEIKI